MRTVAPQSILRIVVSSFDLSGSGFSRVHRRCHSGYAAARAIARGAAQTLRWTAGRAHLLRAGRRHIRARRSRSAFPTTETELGDMAAAANIGESNKPKVW
jgi:hypothetical protein